MTTPKDGGFAFPRDEVQQTLLSEHQNAQTGMTLRDYFAAKAMQGMAAGEHWAGNFQEGEPKWLGDVAKTAFAIADVMLAERSK